MRIKKFLYVLAVVISGAIATGCGEKPPIDFGDSSTGNLIYQSWNAASAGDGDRALIYAEKLIEVHSAEAAEMQAALSDYPPTDPAEATYKYETLNMVGLAYFTKGEILMTKGDKPGALQANNNLIDNYGYAQYDFDWLHTDISGQMVRRWWKPAEVAREKVAQLESSGG